MDKSSKFMVAANLVATLALVGAVAFALFAAPESPIARSTYNVPVYVEQGGAKMVVESSGEIEIQSGATFDLQAGATTDFSSGVDLDGGLLDLDANGNTSIQADTDDQIDIEISGADDFQFTANTFTALAGSSLAANTIAETTAATGVTIDGLTLKDGEIQDSAGFTVTGQADVVQFAVTGYQTQTGSTLVVEQSDGTDVLTVSDAGNLDADGTFNYGAGDITPLSFDGTTQYEVYFGNSSSVTQTVVDSDTHNMTTAVDWGDCFVSDPDADAGDPAYCTISISGTEITFQALDDDGDNASTAATKLYYFIIGR